MFIVPLDWIFFRRANWWLGYAAVFTLLYVWGVRGSLLDSRPCTPLELVQTIFNGIGIIALWGLGIRKAIIRAAFWKAFFVGDVCGYALMWVVPGSPHLEIPFLHGLLITLVLFGPYYTGIFLYAFRSQGMWNRREGNEQNPRYVRK